MRKVGFSLQLALQHGHRGRKEQNWVLPLLPAALLIIRAGISSASPSLFLCWVISSLPPARQLASHPWVGIPPLADKLQQLPLPPWQMPVSCVLPCHREGAFLFKGEKKANPNNSSAALFCFVVFFFDSPYLFPWLLFVISLQKGLV